MDPSGDGGPGPLAARSKRGDEAHAADDCDQTYGGADGDARVADAVDSKDGHGGSDDVLEGDARSVHKAGDTDGGTDNDTRREEAGASDDIDGGARRRNTHRQHALGGFSGHKKLRSQ